MKRDSAFALDMEGNFRPSLTPLHDFLDNNLPDRGQFWTSNLIDCKGKKKRNYREYSPSKMRE